MQQSDCNCADEGERKGCHNQVKRALAPNFHVASPLAPRKTGTRMSDQRQGGGHQRATSRPEAQQPQSPGVWSL